MGAESFIPAIRAINVVHAVFSRHLPKGSLEEWRLTLFRDHPSIMITNRYFTEKRLCAGMASIRFHQDVDPKGILENMTGDKLIHTQENHVDYYQQVRHRPTSQYQR